MAAPLRAWGDRCVGTTIADVDAISGTADGAERAADAGMANDSGPIAVDFVPTNIPSAQLTAGSNALSAAIE